MGRLGRRAQRRLIVGAAGIAGALLAAAPTGVPVTDALWCAAFVAALAWVGGFARRELVLAVATGAVAVAATPTSLGFAIAGVVIAALHALRSRGAIRLNAATSGAIGLSLLTGSGPDPTWAAVVTTTVLTLGLLCAGTSGMEACGRRLLRRTATAVTGAALAATMLAVLATALAAPDLRQGVVAVRSGRDAGRSGDLDAAAAAFGRATTAIDRGLGYVRTLARPAIAVPGLAQQVRAGEEALSVAAEAAASARWATAAIPSEVLRFERGTVDLDALAAAEPPLGRLVTALDTSSDRLARIDRGALLTPVAEMLDDAAIDAREAWRDAGRLHRGVQVAPSLLGADGSRRYLVLFTSPVEARNRFGFPGAYGVLAFDEGRFTFEGAGPITDLTPPDGFDQQAMRISTRVQPYLAYGPTRTWSSVTIPPHFPAVAELATQMALQSPAGRVDGVILADPEVLAATVGLVGDVAVRQPGGVGTTVLSAATTVEFVNRTQYLQFPDADRQGERKEVLTELAGAVGDRLETASLPDMGALVDLFAPLVSADHLALGIPPATSIEAATLMAETGADGGFEPGSADLLHVAHINATGNKIDLFLERSLSYDVAVAEDGGVVAELSVELHNSAPGAGLPDYLLGTALTEELPRGTNRTTVLLYSRHGLESITVDGTPLPFATLVDGGVNAYEVQVDLGPGSRRTIAARLTGAAAPGTYRLTVLPNGLARPDELKVRIDDARTGASVHRTLAVRRPHTF